MLPVVCSSEVHSLPIPSATQQSGPSPIPYNPGTKKACMYPWRPRQQLTNINR
jgi:hypothetical protein